MLEFVNFYLIPGLVLGSIYALGAIGITMLFGILRFAHFGHGDMMTMGAYVALAVVLAFGLPAMWALPIAMVLAAGLAVGIDRLFYKPLRSGPTIVVVIASFGVALMIRSVIQVVFGVDVESYQPGFQRPVFLFDGSIRILPRHLTIMAVTAGLMLALHMFLTRTKMGKAMRAMSDDPELARATGIDTGRVVVYTWIIGGGLAAAGGVFLGIDTQLNPMMGWNLLLPMFAAAILGGIGKPFGAVVGGLVIGCAEELATYPWLGDGPLLEPSYKSAVAFAILVIMLIWRPTGLFKGRVF